MTADPRSSLGPECAVLTSIGTLYLYRLTPTDLRVFRDLPATKLSQDKFRVLLTRIGSTTVSEKGILDAGSLTMHQVESLTDDEIERVAESYLDGTTIRWYRHEGASATVSVIRAGHEPATKFIDRLIHWYALRGPGRAVVEGDGLSATGPRPRPRMLPPDSISMSRREAWIGLAGLGLLAILGIGAFLQHYLLVHALQRQQDALIAEVKQTNALLSSHVARVTQENAELRQRLDTLEAGLHAAPAAAAKPSAAAPKPATPARTTPAKSRTHRYRP
jgi:hypothetical protein